MAWKQVALAGDSPSFADLTVTGDITLDDGGSIKEAGGVAAITINASGDISKFGLDTPSDGQVLAWDNGNTKIVWSSVATGTMSDVVDDTSPQLGADLDTNDFNIMFDDAHGIEDDAGNEQLLFQKTASAVNYAEITNGAAGAGVQIGTAGGDDDVNMILNGKGAGLIQLKNSTLEIDNNSATKSGAIRLVEGSDNGSNYVNIRAGAAIGSNYNVDLPTAAGTLARTVDNVATATALATPRAINGTNFDGSAAITITAAGSTLSDTVTVGKGGTGATTLTDGGVLLGSGTGAITALAVLGDGEMIVGDGTTDPVAESGSTLRRSIGCDAAGTDNSTDVTLANTNYLSISGQAITGSTIPVANGGTGATSATSACSNLGVGTEDTPTFAGASIIGSNDSKGQLKIAGDNGDDAGDEWYIVAGTDQSLTFNNDIASAGTGVAMMTITPHATATDSVVTIAGDLIVNGDTTTVNTSTLEVEDVLITIAKGGDSSTAQAGILVDNGDGTNEPALMWNNSGTGSEWTVEREGNTTKLPIATMTAAASDGAGTNSGVGGLHLNTSAQTLWVRTV